METILNIPKELEYLESLVNCQKGKKNRDKQCLGFN
jgi:hypothetical protein